MSVLTNPVTSTYNPAYFVEFDGTGAWLVWTFRPSNELRLRISLEILDQTTFHNNMYWESITSKYELIKPVLPQAAQLGIVLLTFHIIFIEMHILKDTLLFIMKEKS